MIVDFSRDYRTPESHWSDLVDDAVDRLAAEDIEGVRWAVGELQRLRAALSRAEADNAKLRAALLLAKEWIGLDSYPYDVDEKIDAALEGHDEG
jgi:hypothetical protein